MSAAAMTAPRSGRWIPWVFVAGFGVVLAANGTMIWYATTSFPGLVTTKAYDEGIAYNQNLEAAEAQAKLGWQPALTVRPLEGFRGGLELRLLDRDGAPLDGATVSAKLERPVEVEHDFAVALEGRGGGRYAAAFDVPRVGVWDVHLVIRRGDASFVLDERVTFR
ncbi:MAG: FixH family protein [Geminicoccaceae bacterium]